MVFLDDDGGAAAQPARQAAAELRADALTVPQTVVLALEIDALAAQLVLKAIQFGQTREGFLRAMAHHFDAKLATFEKMEVTAQRLVEARQAAIKAREAAATAQASAAGDQNAGGNDPTFTLGSPIGERGEPPPRRIDLCPGAPESCPCEGHTTARISLANLNAVRAGRGKPPQLLSDGPRCKTGIVGCMITHPHDHGDVGPDDALEE